MNSDEATQHLLDSLEAEKIPYMLTGSFASNAYGIPRSTKDLDVVVDMPSGSLEKLIRRLGPAFKMQDQLMFEAITGSVRHIIDLVGDTFQIELFLLNADEHMTERFARRHQLPYPGWGRLVWLPTAEDVIIQKIRWGRPKDLEDARDILAVQGHGLDIDRLKAWCKRHGTLDCLTSLLESVADA